MAYRMSLPIAFVFVGLACSTTESSVSGGPSTEDGVAVSETPSLDSDSEGSHPETSDVVGAHADGKGVDDVALDDTPPFTDAGPGSESDAFLPGSEILPADETSPDPNATYTLTFQVLMEPGYDGGVTIGNNMQGWNTAGMVQLSDPDNDSIFVGTMELQAGTQIEYKFIKGYDGLGTWRRFLWRAVCKQDRTSIAFSQCQPKQSFLR